MTIDRLINILVTVLLIEMMATIGLGVSVADLIRVVRSWRVMACAVLANYLCVPAATVGLLLAFQPADPSVTAGFLILGVCPGAPFGPPCTRIAGGNVAIAVGLMAFLAATSALMAPLLLSFLLPWLAGGETQAMKTDGIMRILFFTQLLPLGAGLGLAHWRPRLAERLQKPAGMICTLLSTVTLVVILWANYRMLATIQLRGFLGMLTLLGATLGIGWLLGGPGTADRRAMALTTSLRNVGVGLVIATKSLADTAAPTAVLAYGIIEILGSFLLALIWSRSPGHREASPGSTVFV